MREGVRKQGFWLYGVIVGLAIRDGLVKVVPRIIMTSPDVDGNNRWLDAARLGLFLLVVTRFYLGSAYYYDEVYESTDADTKYPTKNYGTDFVVGLFHFILFYGWAAMIDNHNSPAVGVSHFTNMMLVVLLYDVVWLIISKGNSTVECMKMWTFINTLTAAAVLLLYLGAQKFDIASPWLELITFTPVTVVSLIDFAEIVTEKRIFERFVSKLLRRG